MADCPKMRRWAPLVALALACNPTVRTFCGCEAVAPEHVTKLRSEAAEAKARVDDMLAGEALVVRDDALGTSWRAVESGASGLHHTRGPTFDAGAIAPFRMFFGLDATREDTGDTHQIEIGVTFVPSDAGPKPLAIELVDVGVGPDRGSPPMTRTFHACPVGGAPIHYARFSPGTSPCHDVPLVPILQCGCDDASEHVDAEDCARHQRTAIKKIACERDNGVLVPK